MSEARVAGGGGIDARPQRSWRGRVINGLEQLHDGWKMGLVFEI